MIAIVRLRSDIKTRKDVVDTFRVLGMKKVFSAALLEKNPSNEGMIRKIQSFATWGEASEETAGIIKKRKNLRSPKGGLKSKKLPFPRGDLGYRGDKINDLVKRMVE